MDLLAEALRQPAPQRLEKENRLFQVGKMTGVLDHLECRLGDGRRHLPHLRWCTEDVFLADDKKSWNADRTEQVRRGGAGRHRVKRSHNALRSGPPNHLSDPLRQRVGRTTQSRRAKKPGEHLGDECRAPLADDEFGHLLAGFPDRWRITR